MYKCIMLRINQVAGLAANTPAEKQRREEMSNKGLSLLWKEPLQLESQRKWPTSQASGLPGVITASLTQQQNPAFLHHHLFALS